jgi:energy-coupling factor transport system permease protein
MSMVAPPMLRRPDAPLARANPVAKLGMAVIVTIALLPTVDPITPAIVLAVEVACLPLTGLDPRQVLRCTWPLLFAAVGIGLSNALFSADKSGAFLVDLGVLEITTASALDGLSLAIRVVAIALPGVLALATSDPTDLADALVQQLRVPWRFAIGALAALRLMPLMAQEWHVLGWARRARGIEAGHSPLAKARVFWSQAFALLVAAIRRGVRMSIAMESRGFGARSGRTYARQQRMHRYDWGLLAATLLVVLAATAISVALGSWQFLLAS